jgi:hypothetical protein
MHRSSRLVLVCFATLLCMGLMVMAASAANDDLSSNCVSAVGDFAGSPGSVTDVAIGPGGVLYAVDGEGGALLKQEWDETFREVVANGIGHVDGPKDSARLVGPYGIAANDTYVFIADSRGHTIRAWDGTNLVTLAGKVHERGHADGAGDAARFNVPYDLDVDASGNLYVADKLNHVVRKITFSSGISTPQVTTLAGKPGSKGLADASGTTARFRYPVGVAVATDGNIYVADQSNYRIRKVTPSGVVSSWAGSVYGHKGGTRSNAKLGYVQRVAAGPDGWLYITDQSFVGVQAISPTGHVIPITGNGAGGGTGNASGSYFSHPWGLTVDDTGVVYVTDLTQRKVRKIDRCAGGGVDSYACTGPICSIGPGPGCTDPDADNFSEFATTDDGTCIYGCTPTEETCDEADNDCDGVIDEGLAGGGPACAKGACASVLTETPNAPDGLYWVHPEGVDDPVEVYCDMANGGWALVHREHNSGFDNTLPHQIPITAVGDSPPNPNKTEFGRWKLSDDTINKLRTGSVLNDIRVTVRLGSGGVKSAWHRKECVVAFNAWHPKNHTCNASTRGGPNATSYQQTGHPGFLSRWYVDGDFGYLLPVTHVGAVPGAQAHSSPNPFCTYYDHRNCRQATSIEVWVY